MRTLILFLSAVGLAYGQAQPVNRTKTYAGTPTAGDCTSATVGVLTGINTTPDPDTIYDCITVGVTPTWVVRSTATGTVTSVDMSVPSTLLAVSGNPITTSGTLALTLPTRAQNLIFAGPASGSAAAPTFRSLVALDIPDLSATYQPLNANLTTIGGLSPSRGGLIRRGASAWEAVALGASGAILQSDGTDAVWTARISASSAIDFASINDGACLENTLTLTGAALGDPVALGVSGTALPAGMMATVRVSAADTAQVQICNLSGAAVDLSSRTFVARVVR
jgi:hypothetical protein